MTVLAGQLQEMLGLLGSIGDEQAGAPMAPGKWSRKQLLGHLVDTERVWTYRALRFARGDATALAGFEQDPYVEAAQANDRPWVDLVAEYEHVRHSTVLFFRNLPPEAWVRGGTASGTFVSVRAFAYMVAGHERHHLGAFRARPAPATTAT